MRKSSVRNKQEFSSRRSVGERVLLKLFKKQIEPNSSKLTPSSKIFYSDENYFKSPSRDTFAKLNNTSAQHTLININTLSSRIPQGLPNIGNTCYM